MNEVIGRVLELARQHFLDEHGEFYKFAANGSRQTLEVWLDNAREDLVDRAVRQASVDTFVEDPQILGQVKESLKFRILAGILTRPIDYQSADETQGGICANLEYDSETGGWTCKVPSNQSQADAWHERHGHSTACPFWKNPMDRNPMERSETELERLIFQEGKSLEEAWQQLGLRNKK